LSKRSENFKASRKISIQKEQKTDEVLENKRNANIGKISYKFLEIKTSYKNECSY